MLLGHRVYCISYILWMLCVFTGFQGGQFSGTRLKRWTSGPGSSVGAAATLEVSQRQQEKNCNRCTLRCLAHTTICNLQHPLNSRKVQRALHYYIKTVFNCHTGQKSRNDGFIRWMCTPCCLQNIWSPGVNLKSVLWIPNSGISPSASNRFTKACTPNITTGPSCTQNRHVVNKSLYCMRMDWGERLFSI